MSGKGDTYRKVNNRVYSENYDAIFRKNKSLICPNVSLDTEIINLLDDPGFDSNISIGDKRPKWIITYYTKGSWDGSGIAVALLPDGSLLEKNLSHCSCYGPVDDIEGSPWVLTTKESFIKDNSPISKVDYNYKEASAIVSAVIAKLNNKE